MDGLTPSRQEPVEIDCPRGYTKRASYDAQPTAGRYTTEGELLEAFCVMKRATEPDSSETPLNQLVGPSGETSIEFEKNDVVVYTFDARNGEPPLLLERGSELWLRTTTTCASKPAELRSIAFVVPKALPINEQKCSWACL